MCNSMNTLHTTELYTLNGWTAKYVGYISVKLLPKNIHQQQQQQKTNQTCMQTSSLTVGED